AAEDVELWLGPQGDLLVSATTTSVGPGYHIFLCDVLHKLGEQFEIRWEDSGEEFLDETGYFHSGNRDEPVGEMLAWLRALASSFLDGTLENDGHSAILLCMPLDSGFQWDAAAITRSEEHTSELQSQSNLV